MANTVQQHNSEIKTKFSASTILDKILLVKSGKVY